jgi:hypothetical protein
MNTLILMSMLAAAGPPSLPPLDDVLRRAGEAVERFDRQFASVNCTEQVSQVKLDKNGKTSYHRESVFDYLVTMRVEPDDMTVEESRVELKSSGNAANLPLLVTGGFATLALVLHPNFHNSYEYSRPEEAMLDGARALLVKFRQLPRERSPAGLRLRGRDYPLAWQGVAWLEPGSGAVMKIDAALAAPMEDVGLQSLSTEVSYAPVTFKDTREVYWLPGVAKVEVRTVRQHWVNVHRFTGYKRFSVETTTATETPVAVQPVEEAPAGGPR